MKAVGEPGTGIAFPVGRKSREDVNRARVVAAGAISHHTSVWTSGRAMHNENCDFVF